MSFLFPNASPLRSRFSAPDTPIFKNTLKKSSLSLFSCSKSRQASPGVSWKPSAFRAWVLIVATLVCWALITVLQILLVKSQHDEGIIFEADINDLPLSTSFSYLYLPTIIAIIFSIFWSWIDLQIKRLEPYYQLSKPEGSLGKDSLLLQYPFDFLPFVPVSAVKNRHWAVFWASTAIVFVTWGLVPIQAGIFATESITRTERPTFVLSTNSIPGAKQNTSLSSSYVSSVYGIIWLNETMPPYMNRDYVLNPFRPAHDLTENAAVRTQETWTGQTKLYSVDLTCETPTLNRTNVSSTWQWKNGCHLPVSTLLEDLGNITMGRNLESGNQTIYNNKAFVAMYMGYPGTDQSDYYLEGSCPKTANHSFWVAFSRTKARAQDPVENVTNLLCEPFYYVQDVEATIDAETKRPLSKKPLGPKNPLSTDVWDSSFFEIGMNQGTQLERSRGALPIVGYPDQVERLSTTQLTLSVFGAVVPDMVGFAVGVHNQSLDKLLDPKILQSSFESVYRLILARSMTDILDPSFGTTQPLSGRVHYTIGAVTMVPAFVYVVEGLLGLASVCSIALLTISLTRKWNMHSDPTTICSVMSLVADNPALLEAFARIDCSSTDDFESKVKDKRFRLHRDEQGTGIIQVDDYGNASHLASNPGLLSSSTVSTLPKPVRPREFRSYLAIPFLLFQIALAVTLGVLLMKGQPYGLPRPSHNAFVRQVFENYIPTAIATFIEPVWLLVNRLLCMLQPLEELRRGKALPSKSIDADYNSLPPQLAIFKAVRSCHFKLATACLMALLANVLAVALSGLLNEGKILVPSSAHFEPPYQAKFVSINGTVGPNMNAIAIEHIEPSGSYAGGEGLDQFLVAESNYTAQTPLPAWTDDALFYVPFTSESGDGTGDQQYQARTTAFGARLECSAIQNYSAQLFYSPDGANAGRFEFTIPDSTGKNHSCTRYDMLIESGPGKDSTIPKVTCPSGDVALELVFSRWNMDNRTAEDKEFCAQQVVLGWVRDSTNICESKKNTMLNTETALFVACQGRMVAGDTEVLVDGSGKVQKGSNASQPLDLKTTSSSDYFTNDVSNLVQQGNDYLFHFPGLTYHNDSFASEFINYFMIKQSNSSRLVDPKRKLPTLDEVRKQLYPVYSKLFAIWLGLNKERLLLPQTFPSPASTQGTIASPQIRIFVSKPLFIVAESIISIYAISALFIYLHRPGRFLPRLPVSVAAIIALFAGSSAVHDFRGTSLMDKKERRRYMQDLGTRYGYGTFLGGDGSLHVGIEKEPLVRVPRYPGVIEKVQTGLSRRSRQRTT